MFKVWIEWELGQDDLIFRTKTDAITWITSVILADEELKGEFPNGFLDVDESGLCSIQELLVFRD